MALFESLLTMAGLALDQREQARIREVRDFWFSRSMAIARRSRTRAPSNRV
jgi:hypothetical protein